MTSSFCFVIIVGILFRSIAVNGFPASLEQQEPNAVSEVVCGTLSIRNDVMNLRRLENCTIVFGSLTIALIQNVSSEDAYDRLSFPRLREITGYLVLYSVDKLKSLSQLFPNLSVIRGQQLFENYALVIFAMSSIQNVGLTSLTRIVRGAVRIENNQNLCFLDTLDWGRIVSVKIEENYIIGNQNQQQCSYSNICPALASNMKCPSMIFTNNYGLPSKKSLCWNENTCQKVCPEQCGNGTCYMELDEKKNFWQFIQCCHKECIGGCFGHTDSQCYSCAHFMHNGRCVPSCPPGTYELRGLRCISESECSDVKWRQSMKSKMLNGQCLEECPTGYKDDVNNPHRCFKCEHGSCRKECTKNFTVDSIQSAELIRKLGCVIIEGHLEIHLRRTLEELEKNFELLEVVTDYVMVLSSYALSSLQFMKSLNTIKGKNLWHGQYALYVRDNEQLEEIFDLDIHPSLVISRGGVFFGNNQKLCRFRITTFVKTMGLTNNLTLDDQDNPNIICDLPETELNLTVTHYSDKMAHLAWTYKMHDSRRLLGWMISYREVPEDGIIARNRLTCSKNDWKIEDINDANITQHYIYRDIKPNTKYVVYVQMYVTNMKSGQSEFSPYQYFTTDPGEPSRIRNLRVTTKSESSLTFDWDPPEFPNGWITHYKVVVYPIIQNLENFNLRDYCTDPIEHKDEIESTRTNHTTTSIPPQTTNTTNDTMNGHCCACPKSLEEKIEEENRRLSETNFEDYLINRMYYKANDQGYLNLERKKRSLDVKENNMKNNTVLQRIINETDSLTPPSTPPLSTTPSTFKSSSRPAQITHRVNGTTITIQNLKHFQFYTVQVSACRDNHSRNDMTVCSKPVLMNEKTALLVGADDINQSSVDYILGDHYVDIHWKAPENPNGIIVSYEIELNKTDAVNYKPDLLCVTHQDFQSSYGYSLSKLTLGKWQWRIRAQSFAGPGSWTLPNYFVFEDQVQSNLKLISFLTGCSAFVVLFALVTILILYRLKKKKELEELMMFSMSGNPNYCSPEDIYEVDEWEVERDKVTLLNDIGKGSFGVVTKGILKKKDGEIFVAVKTVAVGSHLSERISILKEASIMKEFDCYHVVKLVGIVSIGSPSLVILEYMENGDLRDYLLKHRPNQNDYPTLNHRDLVQIAGEIADGMAYLTNLKFVHRDLAARNCLVGENGVVKVGDFGLSRDVGPSDYYRIQYGRKHPVRWMAPEALRDGKFNEKTDIWSYGVVLWEIVNLGEKPLSDIADIDVSNYTINGGKLTIPPGTTKIFRDLMNDCWMDDPNDRSTFIKIVWKLHPHLRSYFKEVSFYDSESRNFYQDREAEVLNTPNSRPLDLLSTLASGESPDCNTKLLSNEEVKPLNGVVKPLNGVVKPSNGVVKPSNECVLKTSSTVPSNLFNHGSAKLTKFSAQLPDRNGYILPDNQELHCNFGALRHSGNNIVDPITLPGY